MLRVQDLSVHFCLDGAEFPVLDEVTFNIGPGEVVGLLGESGCGKTTTALSILRLLPAAGRVVRGTSFSAPQVSGGASLLLQIDANIKQDQAAAALSQAQPLLGQGLGAGRIDLYRACQYWLQHKSK